LNDDDQSWIDWVIEKWDERIWIRPDAVSETALNVWSIRFCIVDVRAISMLYRDGRPFNDRNSPNVDDTKKYSLKSQRISIASRQIKQVRHAPDHIQTPIKNWRRRSRMIRPTSFRSAWKSIWNIRSHKKGFEISIKKWGRRRVAILWLNFPGKE
jgi:hypothetical protein